MGTALKHLFKPAGTTTLRNRLADLTNKHRGLKARLDGAAGQRRANAAAAAEGNSRARQALDRANHDTYQYGQELGDLNLAIEQLTDELAQAEGREQQHDHLKRVAELKRGLAKRVEIARQVEATAKQLVASFDEMDKSGVALEKLRLAVRAPGHDIFDYFDPKQTFRRFRSYTPEIGLDRLLKYWFGGSIMTPHKSFAAQEARLLDFMDIAETHEQTAGPPAEASAEPGQPPQRSQSLRPFPDAS